MVSPDHRKRSKLVYGKEAILPVEVDTLSPRMTFYEFEKNEDEIPVNLDLLPKTMGNTLLRPIQYKQ